MDRRFFGKVSWFPPYLTVSVSPLTVTEYEGPRPLFGRYNDDLTRRYPLLELRLQRQDWFSVLLVIILSTLFIVGPVTSSLLRPFSNDKTFSQRTSTLILDSPSLMSGMSVLLEQVILNYQHYLLNPLLEFKNGVLYYVTLTLRPYTTHSIVIVRLKVYVTTGRGVIP